MVASDLLDRAKSEWSRFAQAVSRLQVYLCCANVNAFISYSHVDRAYGAQAKSVLAEFDIESFLAHEDLEVSEEWQARILSELRRCDLFVPLLSLNFLASKWAPQEAGFIISRPDVLITPLSIDGTTPFGFLSHLQSRRIPNEGLTRDLLIEPLATTMIPLEELLERMLKAVF